MSFDIERFACYQFIIDTYHTLVNDEFGEVEMITKYSGSYISYPYHGLPLISRVANGSISRIYLNHFGLPTQVE